MTYYKRIPISPFPQTPPDDVIDTKDGYWFVPIGPCKHGKWDGHWPKGKCHCKHKTALTDVAPNIGVWQSTWLEPDKREWRPCWHEPWCNGANL